MRRSFLLAPIVPVLAFAAVTFAQTREAAAGPIIDLNLNLGTALNGATPNSTAVDFSVGGGAGVGYRFHIRGTMLYLQPELTGQYMRFGFNSTEVGYNYAGILNGGLRFGLSGIVQPNVFGHLGVGFLGFNSFQGNGYQDTGELGPEMDVGVGLDFRIVPGFTLGAQVAYNTVVVPSSDPDVPDVAAKWFSFGLKAGFQFGEPRPRVVYVRGY
jgi:hypothetical protein